MPNRELFDKIYRQITAHPETHGQSTWESESASSCGTTRCVAGWAVYFHHGGEQSVESVLEEKFGERARLEDVSHWDYIEGYAAELLGIPRLAADHLFMHTSNGEAVGWVHYYAGLTEVEPVD